MPAESPWPYFGIITLLLLVVWLLQTRTRLLSGPAFSGAPRAYRSLEGLRGILAFSVLVHHAAMTYQYHHTHKWAPPVSRFYSHLGHASVALFFILSGFLFWGKARAGSLTRWRDFLANRVRRIVPGHVFACSLALLVVFAHSQFTLRESVGMVLLKSAQWLTFSMPLYHFATFADVNRAGMMAPAFGITWTLHFEWIFYLSLPGLVWLTRTRRRALGFIPIVALVALAASDLLTHPRDLSDPNLIGLPFSASIEVCTFAAALVVGFVPGILSTYVVGKRWVTSIGKGPLADSVALGTLGAVVALSPAFPLPYYFLLVIPFILFAAGNDLFGLLSARPMLLLGRISYSFYMLHCAVLVGITNTIALYTPIASMSPAVYWGLMAAVVLVVLGLSLLSYRFVEYPWLANRERTPAEPVVLPARVEPAV